MQTKENVVDERWTTVSRVVFPVDADTDILPLYVDFNAAQRVNSAATGRSRSSDSAVNVIEGASHQRADAVIDRRRIKVDPNRRISLGTYFNAFPASYWQAYTNVRTVRFEARVTDGATIMIYRSSARANSNRVSKIDVADGETIQVDLPLQNFGDGGWYWFDIVAHDHEVVLERAEWQVPESARRTANGKFTVAITTFNRPEDCVQHLRSFSSDPDVAARLERLIVTDQGNRKVKDQPDFEEAAALLGDQLLMIDQGNLGGSGGFARGMMEASEDGASEYVLLLDDDVSVEIEGVFRGLTFADFTRDPAIVGGHMFNMYERSVLHSFGEDIDYDRFFWGPVLDERNPGADFASTNLRVAPHLHRRIDVGYNGWWMCLIPTQIVREIGLSLPVFIKWDDAEFSLRAREAGYVTITYPGMAVWHVPWTEKDDSVDWQAYFHQRNRWLVALMYSPHKRGGVLAKESFFNDVKHLLSMQYSAVELRLQGLEDLLRGPKHLHPAMLNKFAQIRKTRAQFPDAQVEKEPGRVFPQPKRANARKRRAPSGIVPSLMLAALAGLRQLRPVSEAAKKRPEAIVSSMDGRWWMLTQLDSAIVTNSDGTGAAWYRRDTGLFWSMLKRSAVLHARLLVAFPRLSRSYQKKLPEYTSPAAWRKTFEATASKQERGAK